MSNGHQWSKFWWRDWLGDNKLRLCDAATRGIWMDLLCLMHEADGYLLINNVRAELRQIARILQTSERQIERALRILQQNGVASITNDGVIYCQRMVADFKASGVGRASAERRWNGKQPSGSPNGEPSGSPNGKPNAKKLEADREEATLRSASSAADAAKTAAVELFTDGERLARRLLSVDDERARSFVGGLLKAAKGNHALVLAKLRECDAEKPLDPPTWLMAAVGRPFRPVAAKAYRNGAFTVIENDMAKSGNRTSSVMALSHAC